MNMFLKKYWNGEEKLWKVFWIWNFFVQIIISTAADIIFFITVFPVVFMVAANKNFDNISFTDLLLAPIGFFALLFSLAYCIWAMVSLWRSAFNSSQKIYGYLARLWVVLAIFLSVIAPTIGILFPDSIFNDFGDEIFVEPGEISYEHKAPTDLEWSKITFGQHKVKVKEILGTAPLSIGEDAQLVWNYWTYKYNKDDDDFLKIIPWGKVYKVYFDSSGKVTHKKIEFISKEDALKFKETS